MPGIAGGKVAPLSFVTSWERIFREFYLVLFPPGPRYSHLYAKRGAHWACVMLQLLKAWRTDKLACFCWQWGAASPRQQRLRINLWLRRWELSTMLFSFPFHALNTLNCWLAASSLEYVRIIGKCDLNRPSPGKVCSVCFHMNWVINIYLLMSAGLWTFQPNSNFIFLQRKCVSQTLFINGRNKNTI